MRRKLLSALTLGLVLATATGCSSSQLPRLGLPTPRDEQGKIVALDVKSGDRILFGKWSGTEVKIDGEELLIMKESDIMGVIEGSSSSKKKAA